MSFFLHVLNDVGKLSAIHVAFDIALLAIAKTTIAGLNIIYNSLNSTSKEVKS